MYSVNSGYVGWSMSKRAADAYEGGERPKSKWTKAAMLSAIREFCESTEGTSEPVRYDQKIERLRKDDIFDRFFHYSSWHHTSKYFNATDFYALDEEEVRAELQDPGTYRVRRIRAGFKRFNSEMRWYEGECRRGAREELRRWKIRTGRLVSPVEFMARYGLENGATITTYGDEIVVRFDGLVGDDGLNPSFFFEGSYDVDEFGMRPSVDLGNFPSLRKGDDLSEDELHLRIADTRHYLRVLATLSNRCQSVVAETRDLCRRARLATI